MKNSVSQSIRQKVKKLMAEKGTKKTKLGEILGTKNPNESQQQKYLRAQRFLETDSKISIEKLLNIAAFFGKSLDYFLPMNEGLCSSEKSSELTTKPLEEIEANLRKMNLDEDFIRNQIQQLRAMEAYQDNKKS